MRVSTVSPPCQLGGLFLCPHRIAGERSQIPLRWHEIGSRVVPVGVSVGTDPFDRRTGRDAADDRGDEPNTQPTRLDLLGRITLSTPSGPSRQLTGRSAELVTYLALASVPQPRDRIADAIWPAVSAETGRERLRTVLARVRKNLGDIVHRTGDTIGLAESVHVDVDQFHQLSAAANGVTNPEEERAALQALETFHPDIAPELADRIWIEEEAHRLRERALDLHFRLAEFASTDGRREDALDHLRSAIAIEPTEERFHLASARILAASRMYARARRQLARAREILTRHGIRPSMELTQLEQALSQPDPAGAVGHPWSRRER